MSDLPAAAETTSTDPDTLGHIPPVVLASYCAHCGELTSQGSHAACRRRLELEPPRFCPSCRRRMKVQVTPSGWVAECVKHGRTEGRTWA